MQVFSPHQIFWWNVFMVFVICYYLAELPFLFFFDTEDRNLLQLTQWQNYTNIIAIIILSIQIWVRLNSGVYVNGVFTTDKAIIKNIYLSWSIYIDLIGILAISWFYISKLRYVRLIFYLKLYNLKYYDQCLTWVLLGDDKKMANYKLVKATLYFYFFSHWSACIYFYIDYQLYKAQSYYYLQGDLWLIYSESLSNIINLPLYIQYEYAFYWSMITAATIGYGDISPKNIYQVVLALVIFVPIILLYSFQNNTTFETFNIRTARRKQQTQKIEIISRFLKYKAINNRYLNLVCYYAWNSAISDFNSEFQPIVMQNLSRKLRQEVQYQIYKTPLEIVMRIDPELIKMLSKVIHQQTYFPNEPMIPLTHFIYVIKGSLEILLYGNDICEFKEGIIKLKQIYQPVTLNFYGFLTNRSNSYLNYRSTTLVQIYVIANQDLFFHEQFPKYKKSIDKARNSLLVDPNSHNYSEFQIFCEACEGKQPHPVQSCPYLTFQDPNIMLYAKAQQNQITLQNNRQRFFRTDFRPKKNKGPGYNKIQFLQSVIMIEHQALCE